MHGEGEKNAEGRMKGQNNELLSALITGKIAFYSRINKPAIYRRFTDGKTRFLPL